MNLHDFPKIAVITVAEDLHAYVIRKALRDNHGLDLHIIESDRLAATGLMTWAPGRDYVAILPDVEGHAVDVSALDLMWWRRPSGKGWNKRPGYLDAVQSEAALDVIYNDCIAALNGTVQTAFHGIWANSPEATRRAETKFCQLQAAHHVGLRVPRTLISQNPDTIRAFCAGQPTIVKAIAGTVKTPLMAHQVDAALLANDASLSLSPAIYQQFVQGREHLRVHVFGDQIVTAHLTCDQLDWRVHLDQTIVEERRLAPDLEAKLRTFMQVMDLRMGIFDLKIDEAGEIWWFEVNPQGQFLFIEGMSGIKLADQFARFLAETAQMRQRAAA